MTQWALFIPSQGFGFVRRVPVPTPPRWYLHVHAIEGDKRVCSVKVFELLTWDSVGRPIYKENESMNTETEVCGIQTLSHTAVP